MTKPVEIYRGREIYRTADVQMVHVPVSHAYCVENLVESDDGPTLHCEGTIRDMRAFIDEEAHGDFTGLDAALDELRKPVDEVRE